MELTDDWPPTPYWQGGGPDVQNTLTKKNPKDRESMIAVYTWTRVINLSAESAERLDITYLNHNVFGFIQATGIT